MNFRSPKAKLGAVVATLLLLVVYNLSGRVPKTTKQSEFESWLAQTDEQIRRREVPSLPLISLDIKAGDDRSSVSWRLGDSTDPRERERVLRILHLIGEAQVLDLAPHLLPPTIQPVISLSVMAPGQEFRAQFTEQDAQSNTKILLMLRLMKEFADNPESSLSVASREGADNESS